MKKVILLFMAFVYTVHGVAQKPAYPSKEQVLKDARNNYVLSSLSQISTMQQTWDKVRLEYKMYVNGNELVESRFMDYQSKLALKNGIDYNDMTNVYILATTPKNSEGYYYEVTVTVTYTRFGGPVSASKWTYKECNIGTNDVTQKGGDPGAETKRIESVVAVFKNYKGAKNTPKAPVNFNVTAYDKSIIRIDSIYKDPEQQDQNLTYQRFWNFKLKCVIRVNDGNKYKYYTDSRADMQVEWYKKEGTNDWKISTISVKKLEESEKPVAASKLGLKQGQIFKDLENHGFSEVYKKLSASERNLYTLSDVKDFGERLEKVYQLIYNNPEEGRKQLEEMVDPEAANKKEIVDSYYNPIVDAKKYLCSPEDIYVTVNAWDESDESEPTGRKLTVSSVSSNISFKREGTEDKEMLKKYKDAGISKETIKSTWGGRYDESWRPAIELAFKNNGWYITNVADQPKKFN